MRRIQRLLSSWLERYGSGITLVLLLGLSYIIFQGVVEIRADRLQYRPSSEKSLDAPAVTSLLPAAQRGLNKAGEIVLRGTVASSGGAGTAVVTHGMERLVVTVGDKLGPWKVEAIDTGLLTLRDGDRTQTLSLLRDSLLGREARRRGVQVAIERDTAQRDFEALRWYTIPLGGQFVGMRLDGMGDRIMVETFGLLAGDTVESVNGLPVTPGFRQRMSHRMVRDELIRLGVRRDGRMVNVTFSLHD